MYVDVHCLLKNKIYKYIRSQKKVFHDYWLLVNGTFQETKIPSLLEPLGYGTVKFYNNLDINYVHTT